MHALLVLLLATAAAGARDDYREIVERYASGDHDQPVRELARQDPEQVQLGVAALVAELRSPAADPPRRDRRERLVKAAALLHSDLARLYQQDDLLPAFEKHVDWAWAYVQVVDDVADPAPALLSFARRWYLLQGLWGHERLNAEHARYFLAEGLRRFKEDPHLLLAQGALDETLARLDLMRARIEMPAGPNVERFRGPQRPIAERRALLVRAESAYRRALARDPRLAEARLRLARVLYLLERAEDAERELRVVLDEGRQPEHLYLAHLFRGRLRQDQGQLEAAAAEYRAAASVEPRSPTAQLALSHVLDRLGERQGAGRALEKALRQGGDDDTVIDGWWTYLYGQARYAGDLAEDLRREIGS